MRRLHSMDRLTWTDSRKRQWWLNRWLQVTEKPPPEGPPFYERVRYMYRYESFKTADGSWEDGYRQPRYRIYLEKFRILEENRKSVWICWRGKNTRISKTARKRFAYPTVELAMESYLRRKQLNIYHCERRLNEAHMALAVAGEADRSSSER